VSSLPVASVACPDYPGIYRPWAAALRLPAMRIRGRAGDAHSTSSSLRPVNALWSGSAELSSRSFRPHQFPCVTNTSSTQRR